MRCSERCSNLRGAPCAGLVSDAVRTAFSRAVLDWFAVARRPLPWRAAYDPYHTWIAEVMLQQTQMERGVSYYTRWLKAFPDIASVASAPEEAVLRAWEGLGYYRRARHIQAAARIIMERWQGRFPERLADILALPGIGPYAAAAIASTAFGQDVACVDGNVERVLARVFDIDTPVRQAPAKGLIRKLAQELLPVGQAGNFNQGVMELGALVCRKKALCRDCPLAELCAARRLGIVNKRPAPGPKAERVHAVVVAGVLRLGDRVFVQRRLLDDRVWAGLWEFPGGMVDPGEHPADAVVREFREELEFEVEVLRPLGIIRHSYTTYRLSLHCFELRLAGTREVPPVPALHDACDWRWAGPEEVEALPLPAAHRKLAARCVNLPD
jgi:A/G-specific adenine glycosylase